MCVGSYRQYDVDTVSMPYLSDGDTDSKNYWIEVDQTAQRRIDVKSISIRQSMLSGNAIASANINICEQTQLYILTIGPIPFDIILHNS